MGRGLRPHILFTYAESERGCKERASIRPKALVYLQGEGLAPTVSAPQHRPREEPPPVLLQVHSRLFHRCVLAAACFEIPKVPSALPPLPAHQHTRTLAHPQAPPSTPNHNILHILPEVRALPLLLGQPLPRAIPKASLQAAKAERPLLGFLFVLIY